MNATRVKILLCRTALAAALASTLLLQGCPLLVAGAVGGGALLATDRRTVGAQTDDKAIEIKASRALSQNLTTDAHFNVTSYNRRVLLTGEVPDEASKQTASAVVRGVDNVRGVVNELAIAGASSFMSRSNDSYVGAKVKASLLDAPDLGSHYFDVTTERGIVYLMGLVTRAEGDRAADIASRVPGVHQVVKVFEYITPEQAAKLSLGAPPEPASQGAPAEPAASAPAAVETPAVTTDAVPMSGVTSRPLDQQSPAPVSNSAPVQPGNSKTGATN